MPITISRKKLSTLQGQQGVIAAIDMEKTLNTGVDNFAGDPSLRVLLVDEIDKFPFTDELFDISVRVRQRAYQDSTTQREWLEKHISQVKDPNVVARYITQYHYDPKKFPVDREILKKACWEMDDRTLHHFIDATIDGRELEPMYLAAEINHPDAAMYAIGLHIVEAVKLWGRNRRQVFPGLTHMINQRILKEMATDDPRDMVQVWENLSNFYVRTYNGLTVTITLRSPMAYKAPIVLKELVKGASE